MTTSYSPSGTYPTWPLILPEDGELINEAVLCVAILEPLIDAAGENCERTFTAAQTFGVAPCYSGDTVGDADSTIGNTKSMWVLAAASVVRDDTVSKTVTPLPSDWQAIEIKMEKNGAAGRRIVREDGTVIAFMSPDPVETSCCMVYYDPGVSDWRLGMYSAHVTPGPSA